MRRTPNNCSSNECDSSKCPKRFNDGRTDFFIIEAEVRAVPQDVVNVKVIITRARSVSLTASGQCVSSKRPKRFADGCLSQFVRYLHNKGLSLRPAVCMIPPSARSVSLTTGSHNLTGICITRAVRKSIIRNSDHCSQFHIVWC